MNGNDIEQAVEILKEKIPLNMKNHVKKIVIYGSCAREIIQRIQILMLQY